MVFDGAGTDRMNEIRERIEAEGFEDYTNRIGSHREMLENITGRQLWMRNHPDTNEAIDWIHRKYGHKYGERGIRRMMRDERRGILDGLCREAGRGGGRRPAACPGRNACRRPQRTLHIKRRGSCHA